jgi:alpha-galactosidase
MLPQKTDRGIYMTMQRDWASWRRALLQDAVTPYSFLCGGQRCDACGGAPGAEAVITDCEHKVFPESDCVEWTFGLRNTGKADTDLLSELHSLDLMLAPVNGATKPVIHAVRGNSNDDAPFALRRIVSEPGTTWRINNPGGGKTGALVGACLPFINLELGGRGLFVGLGWSGRWQLAIEHGKDGTLRVTGGIEKVNLALHPGEAICLPEVLVMFWDGDRMAAHNRFRQHILKHHSPTVNGEPAPDLLACATWGGMKTHNHLKLIETLKAHGSPFDCYWVDAGWYGADHETEEYQSLKTEDWAFHVGDWKPNAMVHPKGLKPISDAAHAAGMKFLLWFEVERAIESAPWVKQHPDWYFKKRNPHQWLGRDIAPRIFNFGNPEARRAMTEQIARQIAENGIDVFRQDCNTWLTHAWDEEDTPGRIGISEIRYVEGLIAFWDELKARFPHLLFDIVQRRDLISLDRTLDMSRSDHEFLPSTDPVSSQGAQFGLAHWTPLSGTVAVGTGNDYKCLSGLASSFGTALFPSIGYDPVSVEPPADYPWDWLKRMLDIHRRARPFFRGDFYPLLEHVHSNQCWGAMQFHRADLGQGMVVVCRRPGSPYVTARFPLQGLAGDCVLDSGHSDEFKVEGNILEVRLNKSPAAAVAFYRGKQP